ncbi:MAG TPA: tetratricopeptide repeat protein, partial [Pirellulales bacterium]|nr:tetratricopeptide repeat protein [Pirellulales bacterium]
GELAEAIEHYNAWLAAHSDDAAMHIRVADLLMRQANSRSDGGGADDLRKACVQYRTALAIDPRNAAGHKSLAQCFRDLGDKDGAIAELRAALEIDSKDVQVHNDLAGLFEQQGRVKDAIDQLQAAVKIDPNHANSHYNLGMIDYAQGNYADAAIHWRAAVAARPDQAGYLRPLAWLLATSPDDSVRNGAEAIKLAEEAVKIAPDDPEQVGTLAAAYAEAGQFPKAVVRAEQALDLARSKNRSSLADELTDRLRLYRAGKPYHEQPREK